MAIPGQSVRQKQRHDGNVLCDGNKDVLMR